MEETEQPIDNLGTLYERLNFVGFKRGSSFKIKGMTLALINDICEGGNLEEIIIKADLFEIKLEDGDADHVDRLEITAGDRILLDLECEKASYSLKQEENEGCHFLYVPLINWGGGNLRIYCAKDLTNNK